MNFNSHLELEGRHAFLGGSKWHWINKTPQELIETYENAYAAELGTKLHEHACNCIKYKTKLAKTKNTLNMYVNDAIGFRMAPEVILKYSEYAFGTADAISFDEKKKFLRIHDFKSGTSPTHIEQLEIYAAFFCLEYHIDPHDISMELRIYQNNDINIFVPDPDDISFIMEKTVEDDELIRELNAKGEAPWMI